MTSPLSLRRRSKAPPPGDTGQEALYLRSLSDRQVVVNVKLRDGESVRGWIEYFDDAMVRLTREGLPNLFIYKRQIRSIAEAARRRDVKPEAQARHVASKTAPTRQAS
jgi:host factor-I protein